MSKIDGVIRVHPDGLNGKTLVYVKTEKALTEEKAAEALRGTAELRLRKMKRVG